MRTWKIALVLSLSILAACGSSGGGGTGGGGGGGSGQTFKTACILPLGAGCLFWVGDAKGKAADESTCMDVGGELAAACPSEGLVGCCLDKSPGFDDAYTCSYAPDHTAEEVKMNCANVDDDYVSAPP